MQSSVDFVETYAVRRSHTLFWSSRYGEHASDFQHNILLDHHRPESSHAIYVAPLHLDKERYFVDLLTEKGTLTTPGYGNAPNYCRMSGIAHG